MLIEIDAGEVMRANLDGEAASGVVIEASCTWRVFVRTLKWTWLPFMMNVRVVLVVQQTGS